ncbi:MAG: hypothetical protein KDB21_07850 [Acidimicrobiales bacterium]|nr:hypothetical protein [Acidimicrobiales bacterium]
MDPHVRWLRRTILASVLRWTVAVWGLSGAASWPALVLIGLSARESAAWAALAGQAVAVAYIAAALRTNPVGRRFLRRYLARRPEFVPSVVDGDPHPAAAAVEACGLFAVRSVRDTATSGSVFDLYQTRNRVVLAAVGRETGSLAFMSLLEDGRYLHTCDLLTLPHAGLVVNTVRSGDAAQLAAAHSDALHRLADRGARPVPSPLSAFAAVQHIEYDAYRDLGPWLGAFCNLTGAPSARLLVRLDPAEVLERTLVEDLKVGRGSPPQAEAPHEPAAPSPWAMA